MGIAKDREERVRASAKSKWLSDHMKRSLLLEYEDEGHRSPVIHSRYLGDVGDELGGIVSLGAGGQTGNTPPEAVLEVSRHADQWPHYPGVKGFKELRQAIAKKLNEKNGIEADPDSEIMPVIGCQMGIDSAFRILVNPGDEVMIMDPEYASTEPVIRMYGGTVVPVPYRQDAAGEWIFDLAELEKRITSKTKLFVFSNGGNPSGVLYTPEQLKGIADLAKKHDFFVFADEEYEQLALDGKTHHSIAALPGMKERTITAYSFSKAFTMSGYRIGYVVSSAAITDHMYNIVRFIIQACPALGMKAAHAVLTSDLTEYMKKTLAELQIKRDYTFERLNAMPGVKSNRPSGVYFAFPDITGTGMTSDQFTEYLLREGRVSVSSGINFGRNGEGHVRVSFCVGTNQLMEGLNRMEKAVKALKVKR